MKMQAVYPLPLGVAAVGLLFGAPIAKAAPMVFFGEDQDANQTVPADSEAVDAQEGFLDNLEGVRVEDFADVDEGEVFPIDIDFDGISATLDGTSDVGNTGVTSNNISGRFPVVGDKYLNVGTSDAAGFELEFSEPQVAFGFFATDVGDFDGNLELTLDGERNYVVDNTIGSFMTGALLFWGIVDEENPFQTVSFENSDEDWRDAFGFDGFTIGSEAQLVDRDPQAVPTPGTLTLLAAGLMGLAFTRLTRGARRAPG
ncbi:hypothetical protein J2T57_004366 [Natronocella acetinitrilica]|uniref:PEP-CTERM sorting domain-containing protein n=1 Tax=Natronocella acetinitrilica TaxID=414046 RepID=A0AAE3G8X5_9GAMM|nr:PEP-CTERM sorting domain-containing protein [Natronocella acetinitrilica]MCP1677189.1 hypothetical protein [Natronocella acetinitrilica]